MNKNVTAFWLFITLYGLLALSGCGGTEKSTVPTNSATSNVDVSQPATVEDIQCDSMYALDLKAITATEDSSLLFNLHDKKKTNQSTWQAPDLSEDLIIELAQPALLKNAVITWLNTNVIHQFNIYASKDKENWQLINQIDSSEGYSLFPDVIQLDANGGSYETALFLKVELMGNSLSEPSKIVEIEAFGCTENITHNIELIDWYLGIPTDADNNGKSDSIKENELSGDYFDPRFFTISSDGGIVFGTSVSGFTTSENTKYVRTELREMLRRGNTNHNTQGVNKNNWVFSSAPQSAQEKAGGVDGRLHAELAVNHVTSTGEAYQIGRVIIGQIHANDDEPLRVYYRKLPNNQNGSIYLAHEILGGQDLYFDIIGSRSNQAGNPENGIPLNEKFTYTIDVKGNLLTFTLNTVNGEVFTQVIDMTNSGYDREDQYMYFKAGVYNQNNTGDQHDYVQATFYHIDNSHTGYENTDN